MIYDKIENAKNYLGISSSLDKALNFVSNITGEIFTEGKYEIDGENLFYMVQENRTKSFDVSKYESHRNYIDIQLLLDGAEIIRCAPNVSPKITTPYDPSRDIEFYQLDKGYDFELIPGYFCLIMPNELHAPGIMVNKEIDVKKVVIKIKK